MLAEMCDKFGQKPSDYLLNDLECSHLRLAMDMTIFNIGNSWKKEEQRKRDRQARINDANTKRS